MTQAEVRERLILMQERGLAGGFLTPGELQALAYAVEVLENWPQRQPAEPPKEKIAGYKPESWRSGN